MKTFPYQILLCVLAIVGIVGCTATTSPEMIETTPTPTTSSAPQTETQTTRPTAVSTRTPLMPERVPTTETGSPVTGEVPNELLDAIMIDLVERTGIAIDEIKVIQAQEVIWNDGSLGCPQPGVSYTQALVNGYQVVLGVGENRYDYHAADTGYFFLCEQGFLPIRPPGTPQS
jgi:hypothetical protein